MDETLAFYGGAVKALGGGKIAGYGVLFTKEADLQNERFTRLLAAGMNLPRAMHGMPNESQAQLAKYFLSSTITTCWVGTPENGGAIRIDSPSGSNTKTRSARKLT